MNEQKFLAEFKKSENSFVTTVCSTDIELGCVKI